MSVSITAAVTSSTAYWMSGLSTIGSNSFGIALVAGKNRPIQFATQPSRCPSRAAVSICLVSTLISGCGRMGGASPTGGGAGGTSDNTGDSAVSAGPTLSNFLTRHFVENFEAYASSVRQLIDFDMRYTVQFEREGTYIIGGKIYTVNDSQIPHMICSTEPTPSPNDPVQGRRLSLITATDNSRTHSWKTSRPARVIDPV